MPLWSEQRGVIVNRDRAQQIRDFRNIRFGNITPTDIDAYIEYKNKFHIFIEIKHNNAKLKYGQRLAYERLIDDLASIGKKSIFIVAKHQTHDTHEDIDCAETEVLRFRYNEEWHTQKDKITLKKFLDLFIEGKITYQEKIK